MNRKRRITKICCALLMAMLLAPGGANTELTAGSGEPQVIPVQKAVPTEGNLRDNMALYDLLVAKPAVSKENDGALYPISFVLGPIDGGINIIAQGKSCSAPNDYEGNLDYCAINKFSFAARATGGENSNGQV